MDRNITAKQIQLIRKVLWGGVLLYIVFLFLTVLIRSVIIGVTFDETHTYLAFGRIDLFRWPTLMDLFGKEKSIANNHWLNSILINLLQRMLQVDYNEFIIRLPSLFFFFLYIVGIIHGYRKGYYSLTALIFLISNYYLLEYYGLARGYGMANTWVFFAYLSLIKWEKSNYLQPKYLNWLMLSMSLAVLSNTIVLLLYPSFAVIGLYRLIQHKQFQSFFKRCGLILVLFLAFSLIMLKYHMNISSAGKPLYTGGNESFFMNVIRGYVWTFISAEKVTTGLALGAFLLICGCIVFSFRDLLNRNGPIMLILFVLTNLLMQFLMHKGYIATRVLIPFYAFLVLCLQELFTVSLSRLKRILSRHIKPFSPARMDSAVRWVQVIVCLSAVILCLAKTDLHGTYDDSMDFKFKTWVLGAELTGIEYPEDMNKNAAEIFYQLKIDNLKMDYTEQMRKWSEAE